MFNDLMIARGRESSIIREIFEYGNKRKREIGEENVYDFSLGNPSIPCPEFVSKKLKQLIDETDPVKLHGYTSSAGDYSARKAVADYTNAVYGANEVAENVFLTAGAAASLTITLNGILNNGDEVISFVPYFPEYKVFVEGAGGSLVEVPCLSDFQPDVLALEQAITSKTKAIIINSPNNPSGAVYKVENLNKISEILKSRLEKFGQKIYIISDEPYRELVYDENIKPVYMPFVYPETIICYSFSKSMSLPGERIGYILIAKSCEKCGEIFDAIKGAARTYGFVCAPALFQYMIRDCIGMVSDINIYRQNRDVLYGALTSYGYDVVYPDGAFYLFVKAIGGDAEEFCERAKKHELLLVPSNSFGVKGYVRISYCVSQKQIENSLPAFKKLYDEYEEINNG